MKISARYHRRERTGGSGPAGTKGQRGKEGTRLVHTIFQIPRLHIQITPWHHRKFKLLQQLPSDTRPLTQPLLRVLKLLARLYQKLERDTMWLRRLLVEVKTRNLLVILSGIEFFFWNPLRICRNELVNAGDVEVGGEFAVDLTVMGFIDADMPGSFVVEVELFL